MLAVPGEFRPTDEFCCCFSPNVSQLCLFSLSVMDKVMVSQMCDSFVHLFVCKTHSHSFAPKWMIASLFSSSMTTCVRLSLVSQTFDNVTYFFICNRLIRYFTSSIWFCLLTINYVPFFNTGERDAVRDFLIGEYIYCTGLA